MSRVQVIIIIVKGMSSNYLETIQAATLVRSQGVKIVTLYVGEVGSAGYVEQRSMVTDIGELAGLRVSRVDMMNNRNETNLLQRASDIPAPIMGQLQSSTMRVYVEIEYLRAYGRILRRK